MGPTIYNILQLISPSVWTSHAKTADPRRVATRRGLGDRPAVPGDGRPCCPAVPLEAKGAQARRGRGPSERSNTSVTRSRVTKRETCDSSAYVAG